MSVIEGLCWLALADLVAWIVLGLTDTLTARRLPRVRQRQPGPYVPHWARRGHTPPPPDFPPPAAHGRHARRTAR